MTGESDELDGRSRLDQAKEAVQTASETVQATTKTITDAVQDARRPGEPLDRLAQWTRAAPLHSLAIAFLVGIILGRRR
jgi:ElaB/YqjD/DUF883 family membrane-anchored ribosome-binding protein